MLVHYRRCRPWHADLIMHLVSRRISKLAAPWIALAALVAAFLCYLGSLNTAEYFGTFHDDTLYFSSAQSLAEGKGYRLPSLPGTPPQTKYPILYPWLLSWVCRWQPVFPSNVALGIWVTALFGCWFLVVAFALLRRLTGVGDWPALAAVGLCGFHPFFVLFSGALLAHVPFMSLSLTAALLADYALRRNGRLALALAVGGLAGLAVMTRTIGAAVVLGLIATALYRRAFRQAIAVLAGAAPLAAAALASLNAAPAVGPLGWVQTFLYYTSYARFWKLSVPNLNVLGKMLQTNLKDFLVSPSSLCLFPPLGGEYFYPGVLFSITLTAGILMGCVRQARGEEWKPIHFIFLFYTPVILLWNFSLMDSFLLLFLPLFYAGLWVEGKHLVRMLVNTFRMGRPVSERALAVVLAAVPLVIAGLATAQYVGGFRYKMRSLRAYRDAREVERQELYEWIRARVEPEARFVASDDVYLYLYTGRQAIWPMAFSTSVQYVSDHQLMEEQVAHLTDTARQVGARYWVAAQDDAFSKWSNPEVRAWMAQFRSVMPRVFRTSGGNLELYDLSCVLEPEREGCQTASMLISRESLAAAARLPGEPDRIPRISGGGRQAAGPALRAP